MFLSSRRSLISICLVGVLSSIACTQEAPPEPAAGSFEWTTYSNAATGFRMDVPDRYAASAERGAVLFRDDGHVPIKVYWLSEEEGRHRGLWFGEETTGAIRLAGVDGDGFAYSHCDGPLCSRILSYVIPYRGKYLALEFRSDGPLHAVNRRILDSFELTGEDQASPFPAPAGAE